MCGRRIIASLTQILLVSCWIVQFLPAAPPSHVAWITEVQQPPESFPAPSRPLTTLLENSSGEKIATKQQWEKHRDTLLQKWRTFLGPMPNERPEPKYEVVREERIEGCVRQFVSYHAEQDELVEGYLITPLSDRLRDASGRFPAIVALHQTSRTNIDEIAGVSGGQPHDLGVQLGRAGFIVFCPRCYLWQTPPKYEIDVKTTVANFHRRHPKTLGMHKMLFDAQRAVDILTAMPRVNSQRIGAIGHSLGGKEAFYLAAFDERIRAAVASEGGVELTSTNWHDPWYLGSRIREADFRLNHHELMALVAPRSLLIAGGETGPGAVDGTRSWPYIRAAKDVYDLYGGPAKLGLINHGQGHTMPPNVRLRMIEWLEVYLSEQ